MKIASTSDVHISVLVKELILAGQLQAEIVHARGSWGLRFDRDNVFLYRGGGMLSRYIMPKEILLMHRVPTEAILEIFRRM